MKLASAASAALLVLCACAASAPPQPATTGVVARAVIDHPRAFPEGIAVDPRTGIAYVGSAIEGHLWRIRPGAPKAELLQPGGAEGRKNALGMKVDARGRLWVAGGEQDNVSVIDTTTGATLATHNAVPGMPSVTNDLVIAGHHVYVTDSFRPILFRVALDAAPQAPLEPWLDFTGTPLKVIEKQWNLNGIVASPDARLLLVVQMNTGQLWRIDIASKAVSEVKLEGGDVKDGDGLLLRGADDLYVVRNGSSDVTRVRLAPGWTSGRIVQRIKEPSFRAPTTAAATERGLMVVNSQIDKFYRPPPELPFEVLTIGWPRP